MTKCTSESISFPVVKGRKLEAIFSGQAITSDGGAALLRAAVVSNTRRIRLLLSDCYPYKELFRLIAARLCSR